MADKNYILTVDQYGRRAYQEVADIKGINAETLGSIPVSGFTTAMTPEKQWAYRVQGNLTLHLIEYPLYVLDGSNLTSTLTLPTAAEMALEQGTIITFLNPTKDNFIINGNGINIVRVATEAASITLTEYQSIKLILLDIGKDHNFLWYELISIPVTNPEVIATAVGAYLITNPPSGGLTIDQIKADTSIADAITKKHTSGSDNQDLSNLVVKVTGKGLSTNDYTGSGSNTGDETAARIATIVTGAGAQTTPLDADEFPFYKIVGTVLSKVTWANIKATLASYFTGLYNPLRLRINLSAPAVSSGTTEKVLLSLLIPAARAGTGSTFRCIMTGNSSSTGTLKFQIRSGAGGTITDTIDWTAVTSVAQVANARAGFDCLVTVRSATTIAADGVGYAGAVQLPTVIAVPTTPAIVVSNPWYINLTVICSSGTFTAQVGSIEEIK